ncbi:MAG: hypothetical protein N3D84_02250 [Candidatus Woesearchaeota archaeon]|nr:hypothetical protein [Candidatus Woesearchaeota archaeon]
MALEDIFKNLHEKAKLHVFRESDYPKTLSIYLDISTLILADEINTIKAGDSFYDKCSPTESLLKDVKESRIYEERDKAIIEMLSKKGVGIIALFDNSDTNNPLYFVNRSIKESAKEKLPQIIYNIENIIKKRKANEKNWIAKHS